MAEREAQELNAKFTDTKGQLRIDFSRGRVAKTKASMQLHERQLAEAAEEEKKKKKKSKKTKNKTKKTLHA